jgi:hypothetical protein
MWLAPITFFNINIFSMHKLIFIPLLIIIPMLLGSCGQKTQTDANVIPGAYHYENRDLGFEIDLPADFEYFQTQRKAGDGFIDLEFFVPTSDTTYAQEVPGYGKPLVVRVFEKNVWDKPGSENEKNGFEKIGQSDRVYAIKFWREEPKDWLSKWNEDYKDSLINLIKIY